MDLLNQKGSFSSVSPKDVKHKHKNGLQQMEQSTGWESGVLTIKGEESIFRLLKKFCNRLQKQKVDKAGSLEGSPQKF